MKKVPNVYFEVPQVQSTFTLISFTSKNPRVQKRSTSKGRLLGFILHKHCHGLGSR